LLGKQPSQNLSPEGRRNTKILVVDDNLLLASLLQMILEEEGYEAQFAGNGLEAYANYLLFRPEVVITDLHMPKANGIELMKNIRKQDPGVKTIYMSADMGSFSLLLDEEKSRYSVSLLPKPFSKEELLDLLAKFVNGGEEGGLPESPEPRSMSG
jgi:two-component system, chemotaxis family, chemotaxis protein CheY